MDPTSRRDRLFRAIESGRLTPEQGEELARRRNLLPLMPKPPTVDVSSQLRWTLPMSLAWLVWGDLDSVARYAPERKDTAFFWRSIRPVTPKRREGAVPEAARSARPNMRDLSIAVAYSKVHGEAMAMSLAAAKNLLWQWLGEGKLPALGYGDNGELRNIDPALWGELEEHVSLQENDALSFRGPAPGIAFRQVTVDRAILVSMTRGPCAVLATEGERHAHAVSPKRSGAPGRPSSMHLVEGELDRRIRGRIPFSGPSIQSRATELHAWFAKTHPEDPPLTVKTIKNRLASKLRAT